MLLAATAAFAAGARQWCGPAQHGSTGLVSQQQQSDILCPRDCEVCALVYHTVTADPQPASQPKNVQRQQQQQQ